VVPLHQASGKGNILWPKPVAKQTYITSEEVKKEEEEEETRI
jgi:hypothetical protein